MHSLRLGPLAVTIASLVLFSACTPVASPDAVTTQTPVPTSAASTAPDVILDPDIALYVSATATDASGVTADVSLRLHLSTSWSDDDDSAVLRPQFIESACASNLTPKQFADEEWSFALVDVSAAVASGSWPAGSTVGVLPAADDLPIAAGGIIVSDLGASASGDPCASSKAIGGSGDGTLVMGLAGDSAGDNALTAWTGYRYGFAASSGFTLSNCVYLVTAAGQTAGGTGGWDTTATSEECSVALA